MPMDLNYQRSLRLVCNLLTICGRYDSSTSTPQQQQRRSSHRMSRSCMPGSALGAMRRIQTSLSLSPCFGAPSSSGGWRTCFRITMCSTSIGIWARFSAGS